MIKSQWSEFLGPTETDTDLRMLAHSHDKTKSLFPMKKLLCQRSKRRPLQINGRKLGRGDSSEMSSDLCESEGALLSASPSSSSRGSPIISKDNIRSGMYAPTHTEANLFDQQNRKDTPVISEEGWTVEKCTAPTTAGSLRSYQASGTRVLIVLIRIM